MPFLWPGRDGPAIDYISPPPNESFRKKSRRSVVIAGSTGSIGQNAIRVAASAPEKFFVTGLAGGNNVELLARQAAELTPPFLAVISGEAADKLRGLLPYRPEIFVGPSGYARLASLDEADVVLNAQAGAAGLGVSIAALEAGKVLALANKESLVLAGGLLRRLCERRGGAVLPVDSEHYAIFQCVSGRGQSLDNLILTASGGPFRNWEPEAMRLATARCALNHPNWSMGAKITVDSATLMNKGLEWIEAVALFGVSYDRVKILIHPQSIVHSLARFRDQSLLAQFAAPDMRLPISAALLWPEADCAFVKPLDLTGSLMFYPPDWKKFPCLGLAERVLKSAIPENWRLAGFNPACVVLNAANEVAVAAFLDDALGFGDIARVIRQTLDAMDGEYAPIGPVSAAPDVAMAAFSALDRKARELADAFCRET